MLRQIPGTLPTGDATVGLFQSLGTPLRTPYTAIGRRNS